MVESILILIISFIASIIFVLPIYTWSEWYRERIMLYYQTTDDIWG